MTLNEEQFALLRLTLTPGLGPVLIGRLVERFGSACDVLRQSAASLATLRGIGATTSDLVVRGFDPSLRLAEKEAADCERLGVSLVVLGSPEYPSLLASTPGPPVLLYVRGSIDHASLDRYACAIVGSRKCSAYGVEQAERFGIALARSGVTVVSGGAYGIDAAAHRGALRGQGRTLVVLGCGVDVCYPAEHRELFEQCVAHGAVVSELPLHTPPNAQNFTMRNRIISGLSLGVLVIEAQQRSGALTTARFAAEDHGREVFALPGRVDSDSSVGSLNLLKQGGAMLVTEPADVLAALESPAGHVEAGTHATRFVGTDPVDQTPLFPHGEPAPKPTGKPAGPIGLTPSQASVLESLRAALTLDQLQSATGRPVAELRADLTILEIRKLVTREGAAFRARA